MSDKNTQVEQAEELLRLVKNVADWADKHLNKKDLDRSFWLRIRLEELRQIAQQHPEQAGAALIGAKAIWIMLGKDAHIGYGVRHEREPLETTDADTINKKLDQVCKDNPDENITELRRIVCKSLVIGRSTLLGKTKYNPLKNNSK